MANATKVNPQVVDAVELTNQVVDEAARRAAAAIAFQEVAQSMVLAVQSGVDHLQSLFTLNVATTGAALVRLLEGDGKDGEVRAALEESQKSVNAAMDELSQLAAATGRALQDFPGPPATPSTAAAKARGKQKGT